MSDVCRVRFVMRGGTEETVSETVRLRFYKDRYQPSSVLGGRVIWDGQIKDVLGIKLDAGGHTIHHGYAEYIRSEKANGRTEVTFSSPGWSRLLSQNEPVPGMNYDVTLDSLLAANVHIPYVSCESGTAQVGYIYVKEHSSIWDAVTAYSRKAYGTFPFILINNKVAVRAPSGVYRSYTSKYIVSMGTVIDRRTALSKAYMADIDDQYTYWAENPAAIADMIVRERYYPLDMQWLGDPQKGPLMKVDLSKRKYRMSYVRVIGYRGEDLFDSFTAVSSGNTLAGTVGGIEVIFDKCRAVTTVYIID